MSPPHFSFDIQVEIIKRLPVKSLLQFRSVCKAWKSLIYSSQFIAGYNFRHDQSEHLLVTYDVGDGQKSEVKYVSFVDDDTFPQQKFAHIFPPTPQLHVGSIPIGSSCGLLCFFGQYFEKCFLGEDVAVIWNPSIKKSIAVVVPNVLDAPFLRVVGFGVCPETNDPKLVKITYISSWFETEISYIPGQVMVFSVNSKEWKYLCNNLPRKSIQFSRTRTVAAGKFFYWLAYDAEDDRIYNLIMSFDMGTEEFREVNLPDSFTHLFPSDFSIFRLRDSLALLKNIIDKPVYAVWMMDHGDTKSFTKIYTFKPPHVAASIQSTLRFRKSGEPIFLIRKHFKKSGEPVIEMHYEDEDDDEDLQCALVVYESSSQLIKDLGICGNISFVVSVECYTESLLLLDHDDGHIVRCGEVKG